MVATLPASMVTYGCPPTDTCGPKSRLSCKAEAET